MIEYYKKNMEIIGKSIQSIDGNMYGKLIEESYNIIMKGGKIIASGLGKNVPICEKFV